MFTGIVKNIGNVFKINYIGALAQLEIESNLDVSDVSVGDSVAVNGVCLTVVNIFTQPSVRLVFDLGPETLEKTTLSTLRPTQKVHLEKAMRLSDRLGGHLVQGHVDGVGIIVGKEKEGQALRIRIASSREVLNLCISKGSIAIDGISLTINNVNDTGFDVCMIPHTLEQTCFDSYQVGDRVNLENDLIGKYVERLLVRGAGQQTVTWDLLKKSGFLQTH